MGGWSDIENGISETTGTRFRVQRSRHIGGGCINEAHKISDGSCYYFVKFNEASKCAMFEAEFDALKEIEATNAIRVPKPVCLGSDSKRCWIVMEFIEFGGERARTQRELGQQLAKLHQTTGDKFGWHRDNTIGITPQINTRTDDWIDFYREFRLRYQFDLAAKNGRNYSGADKLLDRLEEYFEDYEPQPSLLHGDLWSGNVACDDSGTPVIFDPASYYGDREAEFGIIEMFGGFGREFYAGYNEVFPLNKDFQQRLPLYLLYHQLNHFNIFGGSYAGSVENSLGHLLR